MKALDVFSCIGCHAIGFERAGNSLIMPPAIKTGVEFQVPLDRKS